MKAMMRDASWYACPGRADVYHVVVEINGQFFPACNTTLRHGHMAGHKGVILERAQQNDPRRSNKASRHHQRNGGRP